MTSEWFIRLSHFPPLKSSCVGSFDEKAHVGLSERLDARLSEIEFQSLNRFAWPLHPILDSIAFLFKIIAKFYIIFCRISALVRSFVGLALALDRLFFFFLFMIYRPSKERRGISLLDLFKVFSAILILITNLSLGSQRKQNLKGAERMDDFFRLFFSPNDLINLGFQYSF